MFWAMRRTRRLSLPGTIASILLAGVSAAHSAPTAMDHCESLSGTKIQASQILHASFVKPPFIASWNEIPGAKENVTIAFCRIEAAGSSGPGSDIRFEVWLPEPSHWNGRMLGIGGSRSVGSINTLDLGLGVNRGYAAVATDNGHHGFAATDISWALDRPERIADFGYRAHHLATQEAKALIEKFYRRKEMHAYYFGCSQGGFMGLLAAQRYPADYDGIVAGAPVYSWAREMTFQAWNYRALTETADAGISKGQMQILYSAVQRQCAGKDGLVADPRHCSFDPSVLRCPDAGAECLTPAQVASVAKMYTGPHKSSGEALNRGLTPGSESTWKILWDISTTKPVSGGSWLGTYRNMVFDNPTWDPKSLNFDHDADLAVEKIGPFLDANNPNLDAFRAHGGKLLIYHGWGDQMVPAETSTDYRSAVIARMGSQSTDSFLRLFMIPGMAHCVGGPGAAEILHSTDLPEVPRDASHDVLAAMAAWVEDGHAPDRLIALKADDHGDIIRSRLLCPEPQSARYRESGDPLQAANWDCVN
jgi:pimeloyl-ACP methyl ester carboxylesterase